MKIDYTSTSAHVLSAVSDKEGRNTGPIAAMQSIEAAEVFMSDHSAPEGYHWQVDTVPILGAVEAIS